MTSTSDKTNGTWQKLMVCVLGIITLFSTGWAASATSLCAAYSRIEKNGTKKSQELETRVVRIETTLDVTLRNFKESVDKLASQLEKHQAVTPGK